MKLLELFFKFITAVKSGGVIYALRKVLAVWRRYLNFAIQNKMLEKKSLAGYKIGIRAMTRAIDERTAMPNNQVSTHGLLIISGCKIQQCVEYRINRKMHHGDQANFPVYFSDDFDWLRIVSLAQICSVVVIYRTVPKFLILITKECDRLGIPILFEIDDLVLPKIEIESSGVLEGLKVEQVESLKKQAVEFEEVARVCDGIIVSTEPLQVEMESHFNVPVYVLPNVTRKGFNFIDHSGENKSQNILAYTSPSVSVDQDIQIMAAGLMSFLSKNPIWRVLLFGNKKVHDLLVAKGIKQKQLVLGEQQAYERYLVTLAECDLVLIPLESNSFNECKTMVRFLDATIAGVPTVYSPVGEMRILKTSNQCLGASVEEGGSWEKVLCGLVKNQQKHAEIVNNARDWLIQNRTVESQMNVFNTITQIRKVR